MTLREWIKSIRQIPAETMFEDLGYDTKIETPSMVLFHKERQRYTF